MSIYFVNIKTLKITEQLTTMAAYDPKKEWRVEAKDIRQAAIKFVDYVHKQGLAHKTFNTTAKKDVVEFIMNKQTPLIGADGEFGQPIQSEK